MSEPRSTAEHRRLLDVIARLRAPDGCPWDRKQTTESMAPHLLEEAYEAIEALQRDDRAAACEELGDVLMNVYMIAQIASESGHEYDAEAVAATVADKLIRRHPHVFEDAQADDADQVLSQWEAIKKQEAGDNGAKKTTLSGVPAALPALLKAFRVGEKAARTGFDWPDAQGPRAKLDEELGELDDALQDGDPGAIADELGDVLFSMVNLARHHDVNPEMALSRTIDRFMQRFGHVEEQLGARLGDASLAEMEALWNEAKQQGL